jgi:hypothetical protein
MAETILFSIPTPGPYEETAYEMIWYQSDNGSIWDITPIDSILVSNLTVDETSGKYIWTSSLANANRYHLIKSRSQEGVESSSGLTLPPRSLLPQQVSGVMVSDETIYDLGDTVEFILRVSDDKAHLLEDTIVVEIKDRYDNSIDTIIATKIDTIFVAEYTIPFDLKLKYNITSDLETDYLDYFYLKDKWILLGSELEFGFRVIRNLESPTVNNSKITLNLDGILDTNGNSIDATEIEFTTNLDPYYSDVDSVKSVYRDQLGSVSVFDIAKDIIEWSQSIDYFMKPDVIIDQTRYDNAVSNYVTYKVAISYLSLSMNIQSEMKKLDLFEVSRQSGDASRAINKLEEKARFYENIIYAGGLDTPFTTRTFVKGLRDPNRPNVSRATLYTSDLYPYVNMTTDSTIIELNGQDVEIRGVRTIGFRQMYYTDTKRFIETSF